MCLPNVCKPYCSIVCVSPPLSDTNHHWLYWISFGSSHRHHAHSLVDSMFVRFISIKLKQTNKHKRNFIFFFFFRFFISSSFLSIVFALMMMMLLLSLLLSLKKWTRNVLLPLPGPDKPNQAKHTHTPAYTKIFGGYRAHIGTRRATFSCLSFSILWRSNNVRIM